MTQIREKSGLDRREILKGLGMGTLALPLMTGTTAAERASCSLRVSVEAGEGDWVQRDIITDYFNAKVDVSGLSGSHVAIMVVPIGPPGTFKNILLRKKAAQAASSRASLVTDPDWKPQGDFGSLGEWTNGTYHLYATAVDSEGNIGGAVSDTFEIDTP